MKKTVRKGCFRHDSKKWDAGKKLNKDNASKARKRMISRENKDCLMDEVVNDFLGGSNAAANQAKAYEKLLDDIKNGRRTGEAAGSQAEAARNRMIERQTQNSQRKEKYPDMGRDRANRRAYPATERK